jgi:3-dehydro-L-gulonate 2-dehydrogenase
VHVKAPALGGETSRTFRVPYPELLNTLVRALLRAGFESVRAARCAQLFAESSRDGVYSHGLNRFPLFLSMTRSGIIDIRAEPALLTSLGALERWDGKVGPGNLNAYHCMGRALGLANQHGMGCVALANTNHWMRGGTYGWQAAEAGFIGICWTNTCPNLPPWGSPEPRIGNNPLVIAVPRADGHIVLDMAMSQFSYGALASYRMRGELLPVNGGYDLDGRLTRIPEAIEASHRPLPIGYWKGSGLALMLDLMAGILSGGRTTHQIAAEPAKETGLSQVFIAFSIAQLGDAAVAELSNQVIQHFQSSGEENSEKVRYPGERVQQTRHENLANGVPVEPAVWEQVQQLAA